jgi:thioesterase domain-containing protein
LIGYDLGALLALESSLQLQKDFGEAAVKKLLLLDSAPNPLKANALELLDNNGPQEGPLFQTELLLEYVSLFFSLEDREGLKQVLLQLKSYDDRVKFMTEFVAKELGEEQFDPQSMAGAVERFRRKTEMVSHYDQSRKYVGDLKLVRASGRLNKTIVAGAEADYGLCKAMENGRFDMVSMEGDHKSFLSNKAEDIGTALDAFFLNLLFA